MSTYATCVQIYCRQNDECSQILSDISNDVEKLETDVVNDKQNSSDIKPPVFQNGVLRTNCIDCLDRTNVAQYAYGMMALGRQLHAMGFTESQTIDQNSPLADDLMGVYETMGDTLALQYGGSAAHNKVILLRDLRGFCNFPKEFDENENSICFQISYLFPAMAIKFVYRVVRWQSNP